MKPTDEVLDAVREASYAANIDRLEELLIEVAVPSAPYPQEIEVFIRGRLSELHGEVSLAYEQLKKITDASFVADHSTVRILVELSLARVLNLMGEPARSLTFYHSVLDQARLINDERASATAVVGIGNVHATRGEHTEALSAYAKALALFETLGDKAGQARTFCNMGNIAASTSDMGRAVEMYRRSLALYEECGDLGGQGDVIGNLANAMYEAGDFVHALESYRRAMHLYEKTGDHHGLALVLGNIGMVYTDLKEFDLAMEHFERSRGGYESIGHQGGIASTYSNSGVCAVKQNDLEGALHYHKQALAIHESTSDLPRMALVLGNISSVLIALERFDESSQALDRQAELQIKGARTLAYYYSNRATLAEKTGNTKEAYELFGRALDIATEAGLRSAMAEMHGNLRDIARQRRDFDAYILHTDSAIALNDEVQGAEVARKLAVIEAERRIELQLHERDKERAVLYSALPRSVADRIVRGETINGDLFPGAAVLFSDIAGFTLRGSDLPPQELLTFLSGMFTTFDRICASHGVTKVKTIGDAYMCFKGDLSETENAMAIAAVGLDMLRSSLRWPNGDQVALRIGLHIGPIVAGVIGTERLQYDVWGDTVNVASRMESSGEPGRIHVSETFANILKSEMAKERNGEKDVIPSDSEEGEMAKERDGERDVIPSDTEKLGTWNLAPGTWHMAPGTWHMELRGETELKGKGLMTTYWLETA